MVTATVLARVCAKAFSSVHVPVEARLRDHMLLPSKSLLSSLCLSWHPSHGEAHAHNGVRPRFHVSDVQESNRGSRGSRGRERAGPIGSESATVLATSAVSDVRKVNGAGEGEYAGHEGCETGATRIADKTMVETRRTAGDGGGGCPRAGLGRASSPGPLTALFVAHPKGDAAGGSGGHARHDTPQAIAALNLKRVGRARDSSGGEGLCVKVIEGPAV